MKADDGGMDDEIESALSMMLERQSSQQLEPLQDHEEERYCFIWGQLPEDLVDRVLASLPAPLLLQLRTVCKRWNSLITSRHFSKQHVTALATNSKVEPPHFLVLGRRPHSSPRPCQAYNPTSNKWYTLPLAGVLEDGASLISAASDGGLLCIVTHSSRSGTTGLTHILIYNPVYSECIRELPLPWTCPQMRRQIIWDPLLLVLIVDQEKESFKLVVAGPRGLSHLGSCLCRATEVYDSKLDRWERTGDLPEFYEELRDLECGHKFNMISSSVVYGGHIYCIAIDHFPGRSQSKLLAYDMERNVWNIVPLRMPELRRLQPTRNQMLLERQGQLVLVQMAKAENGAGILGGLEMFTWQPGSRSGEWTPVRVSVPTISWKTFEIIYILPKITSDGKGDLVFFSSVSGDQALLYNMSTKLCTVIPPNEAMNLHASKRMIIPFEFSFQLINSG